MPGISVTETYDALLSTTLKHYSRKLRDNIFDAFQWLKWIYRNGRMRHVDGGEQIVEHLMYAKNTTVKAYEAYEDLDTTPQEGLTIALYKWREYGGTIAISRREKRQNSGEAKLLDLWKAKIKQAELSIRDTLSTDAFADITASPSRAIESMLLLAADSPSTTTVGSVSGATYTWWRNYQKDVGAYANNLLPEMRKAYNEVSKGGGMFPDAVICTQGAFEYYEALGESQKRFPLIRNEKSTLDLGFEVLKYKGADLFWDKKFAVNTPVTGDSMIFVVSDAISLIVDSQTDFVTTEQIEPENQTAYVAKILWMGNLITNNRRCLGILHGIDAS